MQNAGSAKNERVLQNDDIISGRFSPLQIASSHGNIAQTAMSLSFKVGLTQPFQRLLHYISIGSKWIDD